MTRLAVVAATGTNRIVVVISDTMGMKGGKKGGQTWKGRGWQKGKAKPEARVAQPPSEWQWTQGAEETAVVSTGPRRMIGRNVFVKGLLRPYADDNLGFLYVDDPDSFFEKANLRAYLTVENSELDRRPAFGWSMLCGSIRSLSQAVDANEHLSSSLGELKTLLSQDKRLMKSLSKCSWENAKKSKKDLKQHANLVLDFLKKNAKQLHSILPQVMKQSAMLYGGAGQMLDGVVHAGALGRWQSLVPTWPEGAKALRKWKKEKPSAGSTASFLQAAYLARGQVEANWTQAQTWRGDDSSSAEKTESNEENPWGRYGRDDIDSTASSSMEMPKSESHKSKKAAKEKSTQDSSSTENKKSKKKSKKRTPKDKKHRKAMSSPDAASKSRKHKKPTEVNSSDEDRNLKKHRKPADADSEKKEDQKSNLEAFPENAEDGNMESGTK